MSEKAILQRLRTVDRLRELCLALMKVKKSNDRQKAESDGPKNNQDNPGK